MMNALAIRDVKVFVPAKNFALSLDFYQEAGWTLNFAQENIAELELGNHRFFLQNYYQRAWANNFMLFINVADANAWYAHMQAIVANQGYKPARVKAPEIQDYGDLVTFAWDPSGVLLHFAEAQN